MKKILYILPLITPLLFSNKITGVAGDRLRGTPPQDSLQININVTLLVPARIGLYVDANLTFDLNTPVGPSTTYPPTLFPGYYYPTSASATNPQGVVVEVFSNSPTLTWTLQVFGSGNFSPTVTLDQLFIAPDGEPAPSEGSDPPGGNWTSLTTTPLNLNTGGKTNGWNKYNKDFVFQAEADDEPVTSTITLTFRLYAQ
ncbi:MAG: hypothetical protein ABIM85_02225 [candidate division WOR-3 bacterium]